MNPATTSTAMKSKSRRTYNPNGRMLREGFHPTPHDIVCQRGKFALEHEGNIRFRTMIKELLPQYSAAVHKWEKTGEQAAREKVGQTIRDLLHDKYRSSTRAKALRKKVSLPIKDPLNNGALATFGDIPDQRSLHGPPDDPKLGSLPDRRSLHGLKLDFKRRNASNGKWEASFARTNDGRPVPAVLGLIPGTSKCDAMSLPDVQTSGGDNEEYGRDAILQWGHLHPGQEVSILDKGGKQSPITDSENALTEFSNRNTNESLAESSGTHQRKSPPASAPDATIPEQVEKDITTALDSLFPPPDPEALESFSVATFESLLRGL